jgi:hypothetical protein
MQGYKGYIPGVRAENRFGVPTATMTNNFLDGEYENCKIVPGKM